MTDRELGSLLPGDALVSVDVQRDFLPGGALPVLTCLMPHPGAGCLDAGGERIPCYPFPETPARVLRKLAGQPADVPALEELLLRVSALAEQVHEVREMDLNPVFALPPGQGCRIVDARLRVREEIKEDG